MNGLLTAVMVAALRHRMTRPRKPQVGAHECAFETKGIMRDGSVIEYCPGCTRVHVYIIDLDGEPVDIVEIERMAGEEVGDAILRVYRDHEDVND